MSNEIEGLELIGLSKVLGGRLIIDNLNLTVKKGEMVSLLGPSGCGKTTTLRMIAGFLIPESGTINLAGKDVTKLGPEKRPSAMVFQNYALWPHMTVFKNVAYPLKIRKMGKAEIGRVGDEMLGELGIAHEAAIGAAAPAAGVDRKNVHAWAHRRWLLGLALGLAPGRALALGADASTTLIGAAWRGPKATDTHYAGVLAADWERKHLTIRYAVALPSRPHGLVPQADGGLLVNCVRPGTWLWKPCRRTPSPPSSPCTATNSFATRFRPSRNGVIHMTSAAA